MITAPHTLPGGERAWLDGEVTEFTERLGDISPNLALYKDPDGSWLIAEITADGQVHYVMRSKPGARLGPHVLEKLVAGDRRRHDVVEQTVIHNERATKAAEDAEDEATMVAIDKMLSKSWRGRVPSNVEDLSI